MKGLMYNTTGTVIALLGGFQADSGRLKDNQKVVNEYEKTV